MKLLNRFSGLALLAVSIVMLVATPAAFALDRVNGSGVVMSRDLTESTLGINERVYRVTSRTLFKDINGKIIKFEDLDVFDVHQGLFSLHDATKVEYTAQSGLDGWELNSVQVIDVLPD